jgi:uncharacterized protein
MARPKADLPPLEAVEALVDVEGRIAIRVSPGSSRDAIELAQGKLLVRVRARAVDGQANEAVLALVAKALGLAPSRMRLLRGAAAREKLLQVIE